MVLKYLRSSFSRFLCLVRKTKVVHFETLTYIPRSDVISCVIKFPVSIINDPLVSSTVLEKHPSVKFFLGFQFLFRVFDVPVSV